MMRIIWIGILVYSLSGCASKQVTTQATEETSEEIEVNEIPKQRAVYREAETILTDLIHTKLEVNFDWTKSRMNGIATITAKPHFYATDSLILDAKGMLINKVEMNGKPLNYSYADDFLRIYLGKTFNRTDKYTVVIDYVARPEERETGGSAAITSDKGLYFINPTGEDKTKMPQIWTQGETEASSVWFPTIDAPNAKTSQEIFITVDDKYATLSNGKLISSKKTVGGKRVDHWKQELPHAPYLFMMGIGDFKVVKDNYTRKDGSKMEVNYYVEPEWESSARDIFGETPNMIKFFSEKLGVEYPWDKYHQIVVRDYVSGAMENTGAVIFGDYAYKNKRELLDGNDQSTIAHELFHHWFGDLVTCESWSNLTLNESFANYSQYLWDEHRYGVDEADYQAEGEADGYYQSAQAQGYHNLVWFDYDEKEQMFDGHSYNKGGRILHMLRNYLGDEAFFEALNIYLDRYKFKAAEFHQLRLVFEEVSGEDLNWFFNQWYLGSGHPILDFSQEIDEEAKTITVVVEQNQDLELTPIFKLPVQIALFDEDGKHLHKVVIDELEESFTFSYKGSVKGILYDAQQMLLAKGSREKTEEQYIYQYYHGEKYGARKDGLVFGSKAKSIAGQQLILDALNDRFWNIRLIAVGKVKKLRDENKEKGIRKLKEMASNDPNSAVRVAALKGLKRALEENELASLYKDRISNDQSYAVVSTALKSYGSTNPDEAMKLASELEAENSSKMIAGIAQLYAGHGGSDKFDFFKNALEGSTVQGFDKLGLLNSFTVYLIKQDAELLDKGYNIYDGLSKGGSFYMQMFLPQNVSYVSNFIDKKLADLKETLTEQEANNDAAYADKTRKEITLLEETKAKYEALSNRIAR